MRRICDTRPTPPVRSHDLPLLPVRWQRGIWYEPLDYVTFLDDAAGMRTGDDAGFLRRMDDAAVGLDGMFLGDGGGGACGENIWWKCWGFQGDISTGPFFFESLPRFACVFGVCDARPFFRRGLV